MTELRFTKAHGAANDFVVIDDRDDVLDIDADAVRMLCNRHEGIGADGVIRIAPSTEGDFFMDYRNSDGSLAEMCGNGVRVVAKWLGDRHVIDDGFSLETRGGIKQLQLHRTDGLVDMVTVNMGPTFVVRELRLDTDGGTDVVLANSGNPCAVVFTDDVDATDVARKGSAIEHHEAFPEGANVAFVHQDGARLMQRTWERGCGETLACGTAAASAYAVAVYKELVPAVTSIALRGGILNFTSGAGRDVIMTGPTVEVFEGSVDMDAFGIRRS